MVSQRCGRGVPSLQRGGGGSSDGGYHVVGAKPQERPKRAQRGNNHGRKANMPPELRWQGLVRRGSRLRS